MKISIKSRIKFKIKQEKKSKQMKQILIFIALVIVTFIQLVKSEEVGVTSAVSCHPDFDCHDDCHDICAPRKKHCYRKRRCCRPCRPKFCHKKRSCKPRICCSKRCDRW